MLIRNEVFNVLCKKNEIMLMPPTFTYSSQPLEESYSLEGMVI